MRRGALLSARDVLGEGGLLARALPGHEHREGQLQMAALVESSLAHDGVALIEAGTGTGKTFAYLVPALLSGKKVIVSTGTKTLQDQIATSDVPRLRAVMGDALPGGVDVAVLKGLPSYLCRRRYEELRKSAESVSDRAIARALPVIESFVRETYTGDRAELSGLAEDDRVWSAVSSGSDTRIGPRCPYHEQCFVTRARRGAEEASIVVVNHHLFFADLALRAEARASAGRLSIGVLPDYDAVIFDEAHLLEDVCAQFFGVALSTGKIEALARDADRALASAGLLDDTTALMVQTLLVRGADFFDLLPRGSGPGETRTPLGPDLGSPAAKGALYALDAALEALAERTRANVIEGEAIAQITRRADRMRDAISALEGLEKATLVGWVSHQGRSISIGASPVDVSAIFRTEVLSQRRAVVMTSATLTTGGNFSFVKDRLGVDFEVDEAMVASPFAFESQALLYLPELPDRRTDAFMPAAIEEVHALVTAARGGAFVLCTSRKAMTELFRALAGRLAKAGLAVRVQGDSPKGALLEWFRGNGNAVLFATSSFWEGVDVPGDALRLVVIDRLPFEVPSDPLVEARVKRLTNEGREAFMEYLVPAAALALKQGFGRLIRSRRDRGVVAILDGRITKKGYGSRLLASLPPAKRTADREDVVAFFEAR
jgi:ATP-dependent DNA helicase DinG